MPIKKPVTANNKLDDKVFNNSYICVLKKQYFIVF